MTMTIFSIYGKHDEVVEIFYFIYCSPLEVCIVVGPVHPLSTVIWIAWHPVLEKFLWKCSVVGVFFEASDFLIVNLADTVWFDRILWITKMKKNFNTESYDFSLYLPSKAMEENEILILESRG